jgi:uncharacterized protein YjbI with pentapeptide repeats
MLPAKRRRVTVTASPVGIDRAEKSLLRLGFESKSNFARAQLIGKSTVDKFFNRQPIQLDTFKRICKALRIKDWRGVAELEPLVAQCASEAAEEEAELEVVEAVVSQPMTMNLTATRQITVANRENGEVQFEIVLKGDIASIDDQVQKTLGTIFRSLAGSTITITDIQAGSIRIKLQGSPEDVARLIDRLNSGELTEINGFPVEDIQILSQSFLEAVEESSFDKKWDLVREISTHPIPQRQLSRTDLSGADLSGADLSDADLSDADIRDADIRDANLSGANLSGANLSGANLSGANLSGANLSDADLSDADLSGADIRDADLSGANLSGANLSGADIRDADLSDADIRDANLSGANLSGADIRDADLSDVLGRARALALVLTFKLFDRALARDLARDLVLFLDHALKRDHDFVSSLKRACDLAHDLVLFLDRDHDLVLFHGRDLTRDLAHDLARARNIYRKGTSLRGITLSGAIVENARFGEGVGLTQAEKLDLEQRGAIFSDSTGDREFSLR